MRGSSTACCVRGASGHRDSGVRRGSKERDDRDTTVADRGKTRRDPRSPAGSGIFTCSRSRSRGISTGAGALLGQGGGHARRYTTTDVCSPRKQTAETHVSERGFNE